MKPSLLATCPNFDRVTRYLSTWAGDILSYCEQHGHITYVLPDKKATRSNLEGYIKKNSPKIIFLNGHGSNSQVAGHDNEIILDNKNIGIVASANVYALACSSAAKLGPLAMKNSADGYIGYNKEFILSSNSSKTARGGRDDTAKLFLDPSNVIVQSLCKGNSADIAAEQGRIAFRNSIKEAMNSDVQSDDHKLISYLLWDMDCLVSCH